MPKNVTTPEAPQPASSPEADAAVHQARIQRHAVQADAIHRTVFPACMATALGLDQHFDASGYAAYVQNLLDDTGVQHDPIQRMLVEQLALAHLRIAQLHAQANQSKELEAIKLYTAAAARLLGEFRRTALAVQQARTPSRDAKVQRYRIAPESRVG